MNSRQIYFIALMCFFLSFIPLFLKAWVYWLIFNILGWFLFYIAYQKNKKENGNN